MNVVLKFYLEKIPLFVHRLSSICNVQLSTRRFNTLYSYLFLFIAYNFFVCSVTHELIKGCVNDLMNNLIAAMDHPGSAENEYIMKGKVYKPSPSQNGG